MSKAGPSVTGSDTEIGYETGNDAFDTPPSVHVLKIEAVARNVVGCRSMMGSHVPPCPRRTRPT